MPWPRTGRARPESQPDQDARTRSRNGSPALAADAPPRALASTFEELLDVVQIWVDAALRINLRDLKLMQRLVSRQNGLNEPQQVH